jgi:hypothetical protein
MLVNMSMNPVFRNICAVILGLAVGGAVNMALIKVSPHVIPPPAGVDVTSTKSLSASIHLFEPKHFVFPFLAHALGTLAGRCSRLSLRPAAGPHGPLSSASLFWQAASRLPV